MTTTLPTLLVFLLLPLLYYLLAPSSLPGIPNATPNLPIVGNAIHFGLNPVAFLKTQRARHGDVFLVNLAIIKIVFFLGPEGTNAILKGTEKGGISFWDALKFVIGGTVNKGLSLEGWLETSLKIMQKSLSRQEHLSHWRTQMRKLVHSRLTYWSTTSQSVDLFRGISDLTMTYLLHIIMGESFAEKYGPEIVPLVREYEIMMQRPETKILARKWTKAGRFMDFVELRMKVLVGEEVETRLKEPERFEGNMDYLQQVLNTAGDKFAEVYHYHILGLLNGGHTNQTTTFLWSFLHTRHANLLSVLRSSAPSRRDSLLEAIFRETGRLYTNLINLRRTTSPQTILGRSIPKGVFVACSPVVTARDERYFEHGDRFLPQRWLTSIGPESEGSESTLINGRGPVKGDGKGDIRDIDLKLGLNATFNENEVKRVHRAGSSVQFGKGQHACLGEKLGRIMVLEILWDAILGSQEEGENRKGFDIEILEGLRDGVGVDGVGVEANWTRENLGTPFDMGGPVLVRFHSAGIAS